MNIRRMQASDLPAVSAICLEAFSYAVADTLGEEGVATFSAIASSDAFSNRMKEDNLMLVAELSGDVVGVVELRAGRHIAMLFVSPPHQGKGIGKALVLSALENARDNVVTVNASLSSVPAYIRYGFTCKGDVAESAGLIYQPMEKLLNDNEDSGASVSND